ncbi:YaaA family protein [Candidatus Kinetoplastidibacterium galati]|uniref:UPF0246 protein ST1E_0897 n=1 Tax=Candidatus Kinetoplastidibacterium galati TCC219 TaxID=1208921 RepID=M1LUI3_9PROT|nr:YaaA family protein [Candidatus Kinetoplastibacterium galatii]AGF49217.1 conserved hypothetical protein of the DUF328 family [Candidatus Kinetoplastibacterium galatii TCC219]
MLLLLSPSKSLSLTNIKTAINKRTSPFFLKESLLIVKELRGKSLFELAKILKINVSLAKVSFDYYANWDKLSEFNALSIFKGNVYRALDISSFTSEDILWSQDNLLILSGLFGILRPLDFIKPYRLEMSSSLQILGFKNLYAFWRNFVTDFINNEIKKKNLKFLVNLSSNEYFNVIDLNEIKANVVNCVFQEYRVDKWKVIGVTAKTLRGLMARYIITNKLDNINDLKKFSYHGYEYDGYISNNECLFFRKKQHK